MSADSEEQAFHELAGRIQRFRGLVGGAAAIAGLLSGAFGFVLIDGTFFQTDGFRVVGGAPALFAGIVGFLPPFAAALLLGRSLGRSWVRARRGAWAREIAGKHGVSHRMLEDAAELY